MKKAPIIIVLLLIVAFGGYYMAWNYYANFTKDVIVNNIDAALKESEMGSIEYEEVSVSGFPLSMDITLKNSKAKLNSGKLANMMFSELEKSSKNNNMSEEQKTFIEKLKSAQWTDEFSRDGEVVIKTSMMADEFIVKTSGDYYYNSSINGESFKTLTKGDPTAMKIRFKESPILMARENKDISTEEFFKNLLKNLVHFEIQQGKNSVINAENDNLLYSSEGTLILYNVQESGDGKGKVEFMLRDKNSKIEKEFEQMHAKISELLLGGHSQPYDFSSRGLMNTDIHVIYEGGVLIKNARLNDDTSFSIKVPKLVLVDELSAVKIDGAIAAEIMRGMPIAASIKYNSAFQYDEKWYNKLIEDMDEFRQLAIDSIKDGSAAKNFPMLGFITQDLKQDAGSDASDEEFLIEFANNFFDNVDKVLPKFHKWGKIEQNTDVQFSLKDPAAQVVNIKNFEFVINPDGKPQGVKIAGYAKKAGLAQTADINLTVLNYNKLVDDIYANAMNGMEFSEHVLKNKPTFEIKDGLDRAIKRILFKLSGETDKSVTDITINAKADEQNPMPTIGGMPIFKAMGLMQNLSLYIAPILPDDNEPRSGSRKSSSFSESPSQ